MGGRSVVVLLLFLHDGTDRMGGGIVNAPQRIELSFQMP